MPFQSEAQRRYMWMKHPDIAEKWSHGEHSTPGKRKFKARNKGLPYHKRKKSRSGKRK